MAESEDELQSLLMKVKDESEMLDWMNPKLESRFLGEISTNSDMQIIPL